MNAPSAVEVGYLSEIFVSHQGEGAHAGEKHLFVRFAGCNVRCRYCDTPDSLVRVGDCRVDHPGGPSEILANPVSGARLAEIVVDCLKADPGVAMIAITGGEPMLQHRFIAHWLALYAPPVPCLLETNALLSVGLEAVLPHVSVVSADVKLPSNSGESGTWRRHRDFLARCAGVEVYVKMPVDEHTDALEVSDGARLVAETAPGATLFLQPITDPVTGCWRISTSSLLALAGRAGAELPTTRVRPQLHKLLGIR
jgi:7-carboxy-7-deazaguanine synthase